MTTYTGTLTLKANSRPGGAGRLSLLAQSDARTSSGYLILTARTAPRTTAGTLPMTAHSDPVHNRASRLFLGTPPRRYRATYGGYPVLSAEYAHNPQGRELVVTLAGSHRVALGEPIVLSIESLSPYPYRQLSISVPSDGEYSIEQLPGGGARTRLRGVDPEYAKLQSKRLPELIPWVGSPSREIAAPGYRSVTRQVISVASVLRMAFEQAGQRVTIGKAALAGQRWEETRREYTTLNKTPLQIFADTYGALNFELVRIAPNAWYAFAPDESAVTIEPERNAREPGTESRQVLQYPSAVRLQVGDRYTSVQGYLAQVATTGKLPDQSPDENGAEPPPAQLLDPQASAYEVQDDAELYGVSSEGGVTSAYYSEKRGGREVRVINVSSGPIEIVREVAGYEDGALQLRRFDNAVLSFAETINEYLSATSSTLTKTTTTTTRYAYGYSTELQAFSVPSAISVPAGLIAGDLLGQEVSQETYTYSHSGGFLRQQVKIETRITAVGQQAADSTDPANPPSPPTALEKSVTTTTDTYAPASPGMWRHSTVRSTSAKIPVVDIDSGDWVKQIQAPLVSSKFELTDNAPPSVSDPELGAPGSSSASAGPVPPPFQYLRTPQIQTLTLTGTAQPVSFNLDVVEDEQAAGDLTRQLAAIYAVELKRRTTTVYKSSALEPLAPRCKINGAGLVRSYKVSFRPGALTLEATCEQRDA